MSTLDAAFIEQQRLRLEQLRKDIVGEGNAAGSDEQAWQSAAGNEPQDTGDDGERLAQFDRDEALLSHNEGRIPAIDRALAKISEGTYGLSDDSGEDIPRARLEAVPESAYTIEEMEIREQN